MKKHLTLLPIGLLLTFSFFAHAKMHVVPMTKNPDGHLQIKAVINNVEANFILDTGATGSIIDYDKLAMFGIAHSQEKINGIRVGDAKSGRVETYPIKIQQFSIGGMQLNLDSIYSNKLSRGFAADIAGLIGYDALSALNALVDIKRAQLLIPQNQHDIKTFLDEATEYEMMPLHKSSLGFSFVDALIKDTPVRLLIDSGAPELIFDESALLELGLTLADHPTAKSVVAEDIEIPMKMLLKGHIVVGKKALIGDFFTTDLTALMNAVNVHVQPKLIGILGNKHLVHLNSIIDIANAKLYVQ